MITQDIRHVLREYDLKTEPFWISVKFFGPNMTFDHIWGQITWEIDLYTGLKSLLSKIYIVFCALKQFQHCLTCKSNLWASGSDTYSLKRVKFRVKG